MSYKSQYNQDRYINENFFHNKKNGVFVDVGAHDGITLSNTHFFEKELNWTGMCIEANPDLFQSLSENRNCKIINGGAWFEDTNKTFRKIIGYSEMLSGIVDTYNLSHKNRINSECESTNGSYVDIDIKCYNLTNLLINNNIINIDLMSIDTEGSEFDIISNLDFNKINVNMFLIENNYNDSKINTFLSGMGYKFITKLAIDEVYLKN